MDLTERELGTIAAICDTIVPKVSVTQDFSPAYSEQTKAFYERSATDSRIGQDTSRDDRNETRTCPERTVSETAFYHRQQILQPRSDRKTNKILRVEGWGGKNKISCKLERQTHLDRKDRLFRL